VKVEDILFTFGLIIGAIERDLGPVANLGSWFVTPQLRFPSAHELWERVVPLDLGGVRVRIHPVGVHRT
jgi:hypothetical protein